MGAEQGRIGSDIDAAAQPLLGAVEQVDGRAHRPDDAGSAAHEGAVAGDVAELVDRVVGIHVFDDHAADLLADADSQCRRPTLRDPLVGPLVDLGLRLHDMKAANPVARRDERHLEAGLCAECRDADALVQRDVGEAIAFARDAQGPPRAASHQAGEDRDSGASCTTSDRAVYRLGGDGIALWPATARA